MKRKSSRKKKPGFISRAFFLLNCLAAACLLLSYAASFIDPAFFWLLAFFGLAYPLFLLANAAFILLWLFKKPVYALLSAITILIGYNTLLNTVGFRESTAIEVPKSSEDFIRVMTYNVHYFRKFDYTNDKLIKDQMLEVIRREQPDVICIQEFMTRKSGEYNISRSIKKILQSSHYYFQPSADNDFEALGLAVFSKYPIQNTGHIVFPNTMRGNEAIYADIKTGKKHFRVYNVHLQSINFQPEDYKYLKETGEISDVRSPRRIGGRLKQAFIKRSEQAELLKEHAEKCKIPYIIAGDFNDTPASYAVNKVAKGLKNSFREKGSGFGITYNGDFPNFQIDYILAAPNFNVKSYRVIDKKISDHYAVRADLELIDN